MKRLTLALIALIAWRLVGLTVIAAAFLLAALIT